jgi:hypothetical protein
MDLRNYYQKIRQIEAEIGEEPAIVMSLETSDGGKPGMATEVPRETAARLIVELRARLATAEEAASYRRSVEEQRRIADQLQAMSRTQFAVISDVEMKAIRGALKPGKN